jgi:hypothetical protein
MMFFKQADKTTIFYEKFSSQSYTPTLYWTTNREFKSDPFYSKKIYTYENELIDIEKPFKLWEIPQDKVLDN